MRYSAVMTLRPAKFRVLKQAKTEKRAKPGTIIYGFFQHTYGLVSLDNKVTGVKHVAFTLNADGNYPFFTMLMEHVRRIKPRKPRAKKAPNTSSRQ